MHSIRTMNKSLIVSIVVAAAATANATPAQTKAPNKEPNKAVEQKALDALENMGAFLRSQQSFEVRSTTETDYELDNGQTVRLQKQGELHVRRPDHLRMGMKSDRKDRQYFYDGKTFVMYAPKMQYYTRVDAPPTIIELADDLENRYGLELPLVDLFRWGTPDDPTDELTSATYIGPATIDGVATDQYAFRQKGVDWQLWIQSGDKPVPRKLLLTTTDDPNRPQHSIEMTWNLDAKQPDSLFTFNPPQNAAQIGITELAPQNVSQR
jgi:hypothetical protein